MTLDVLCYVLALACFIVAALPNGAKVRFEWLAFAALTLSLVV